jgi:hypothetical protein
MLSVLERAPATVTGDAATTTFIVERGIPLPPRSYTFAGREAKYPFAQMEIGDSFEVPISTYRSKRHVTTALVAATLNNCARGYAKTHKPYAKFATRKIGESSVRVWRTA